MTTLSFNAPPHRPAPADNRVGGSGPVARLAREFLLAANSSMSEEDAIGLGEVRLRELLSSAPELWANAQRQLAEIESGAPAKQASAAARQVQARGPGQAHAAQLLPGYEGHSINAIIDHVIGSTDGELLRLATEVQTLVRSADGVKLVALGEQQLKALKAHFEA